MVIAFKENNSFSFAYIPAYIPISGVDKKSFILKENLPIKHAKGFTLVGSDPALDFQILSTNASYLKGTLEPMDIQADIDTIKDMLGCFCRLDEDGHMAPSLIIAKADRAYRITSDFKCYEISDMDIIEGETGLHNYYIGFIAMENGSPKERIIKAFKKLSRLQLGYESEVVIMNSIDDNVEIY